MLIKNALDVRSSEITPSGLYLRRRNFLAWAGAAVTALATGLGGREAAGAAGEKLNVVKKSVTTADPPTAYNAVTTYNNFYEFGSDKSDPAAYSKGFRPKPWSVA